METPTDIHVLLMSQIVSTVKTPSLLAPNSSPPVPLHHACGDLSNAFYSAPPFESGLNTRLYQDRENRKLSMGSNVVGECYKAHT